jgi:hypothetical protein
MTSSPRRTRLPTAYTSESHTGLAKNAHGIANPKSQARNPKQARMREIANSKQVVRPATAFPSLRFCALDLSRISTFGFRILRLGLWASVSRACPIWSEANGRSSAPKCSSPWPPEPQSASASRPPHRNGKWVGVTGISHQAESHCSRTQLGCLCIPCLILIT